LVVLVTTLLVPTLLVPMLPVSPGVGDCADPEHPLIAHATATAAVSPEHPARNGTSRR
jgi:hypothetical protein